MLESKHSKKYGILSCISPSLSANSQFDGWLTLGEKYSSDYQQERDKINTIYYWI